MSDWYYRKQGLLDETTEGPVSDAGFLQLAYDGKLKLDTLVTHEKHTKGQWGQRWADTGGPQKTG